MPRGGPASRCAWSSSPSRPRTQARRDCTHGQYAAAPPASQHRPPRHLEPAITGLRRRLIRQAALPNPWVSGKQEQPPAPRHRVFEPGQQFAQLAVPPHQYRCRPRPILHPAPPLVPANPRLCRRHRCGGSRPGRFWGSRRVGPIPRIANGRRRNADRGPAPARTWHLDMQSVEQSGLPTAAAGQWQLSLECQLGAG